MREDTPISRSNMVPVLGCVALMLFGLNFHHFIQRHLHRFFHGWKHCHAIEHVVVQRSAPCDDVSFFSDEDRALRDLRRVERDARLDLRQAERELRRVRHEMQRRGEQSVEIERRLAREEAHVRRHQTRLVAVRAQMEQHEARHDTHHDSRHCAPDRHRFEFHIGY